MDTGPSAELSATGTRRSIKYRDLSAPLRTIKPSAASVEMTWLELHASPAGTVTYLPSSTRNPSDYLHDVEGVSNVGIALAFRAS